MNKGRVLAAYLSARGRRFTRRTELARWQEARVAELLRYVLPRSPYYRERMAGRPLADFRALPVTHKADMMAHFARFNTEGVELEDALSVALRAEQTREFRPMLGALTVGLSSGTSGHRGVFLVSERERAEWAGTMLAKLLPGSLLSVARDRVAFFLRANSNLYEALGSRRLRFEYFDLLEPLDQQLVRLSALAPTLVVAPPSLLRELANLQLRGRIAISPRRVISAAEVLERDDAVQIARAFGGPVHQVYQATEGFLGATCGEGTLHLAEDVVHVDKHYLDREARRFTPIVTDMFRRTQPIIRYQMNDVLVECERACACGSIYTAIERIEGRSDDVLLVLRTDGAVRPLYADAVRRAVLMGCEDLVQYGVRQTGFREISLFVEGGEARAFESVSRAIAEAFERAASPAPRIVRLTEWDTGRGQKLRRVVRAFTPVSMPEELSSSSKQSEV